MKNKSVFLILCVVFITAAFPTAASADMGPKPNITVDFEGLSGETYYVTLLTLEESTFRQHAIPSLIRDDLIHDYREWYKGDEVDYPAYVKFVEYQDEDGYHFLQHFRNCSETHQYVWTYDAPNNFKILLYFPDKDSFIVSEPYKRYAISNYFSASITGEVQPNTIYYDNMDVSYDDSIETLTLNLGIRIVLTMALELAIALLCAYRGKKQIAFILAVNLGTQLFLNAMLHYIHASLGLFSVFVAYIPLEIAVFSIEAVLYTLYLGRLGKLKEKEPARKPILYALVANTMSFVTGLIVFVVEVTEYAGRLIVSRWA